MATLWHHQLNHVATTYLSQGSCDEKDLVNYTQYWQDNELDLTERDLEEALIGDRRRVANTNPPNRESYTGSAWQWRRSTLLLAYQYKVNFIFWSDGTLHCPNPQGDCLAVIGTRFRPDQTLCFTTFRYRPAGVMLPAAPPAKLKPTDQYILNHQSPGTVAPHTLIQLHVREETFGTVSPRLFATQQYHKPNNANIAHKYQSCQFVKAPNGVFLFEPLTLPNFQNLRHNDPYPSPILEHLTSDIVRTYAHIVFNAVMEQPLPIFSENFMFRRIVEKNSPSFSQALEGESLNKTWLYRCLCAAALGCHVIVETTNRTQSQCRYWEHPEQEPLSRISNLIFYIKDGIIYNMPQSCGYPFMEHNAGVRDQQLGFMNECFHGLLRLWTTTDSRFLRDPTRETIQIQLSRAETQCNNLRLELGYAEATLNQFPDLQSYRRTINPDFLRNDTLYQDYYRLQRNRRDARDEARRQFLAAQTIVANLENSLNNRNLSQYQSNYEILQQVRLYDLNQSQTKLSMMQTRLQEEFPFRFLKWIREDFTQYYLKWETLKSLSHYIRCQLRVWRRSVMATPMPFFVFLLDTFLKESHGYFEWSPHRVSTGMMGSFLPDNLENYKVIQLCNNSFTELTQYQFNTVPLDQVRAISRRTTPRDGLCQERIKLEFKQWNELQRSWPSSNYDSLSPLHVNLSFFTSGPCSHRLQVQPNEEYQDYFCRLANHEGRIVVEYRLVEPLIEIHQIYCPDIYRYPNEPLAVYYRNGTRLSQSRIFIPLTNNLNQPLEHRKLQKSVWIRLFKLALVVDCKERQLKPVLSVESLIDTWALSLQEDHYDCYQWSFLTNLIERMAFKEQYAPQSMGQHWRQVLNSELMGFDTYMTENPINDTFTILQQLCNYLNIHCTRIFTSAYLPIDDNPYNRPLSDDILAQLRRLQNQLNQQNAEETSRYQRDTQTRAARAEIDRLREALRQAQQRRRNPIQRPQFDGPNPIHRRNDTFRDDVIDYSDDNDNNSDDNNDTRPPSRTNNPPPAPTRELYDSNSESSSLNPTSERSEPVIRHSEVDPEPENNLPDHAVSPRQIQLPNAPEPAVIPPDNDANTDNTSFKIPSTLQPNDSQSARPYRASQSTSTYSANQIYSSDSSSELSNRSLSTISEHSEDSPSNDFFTRTPSPADSTTHSDSEPIPSQPSSSTTESSHTQLPDVQQDDDSLVHQAQENLARAQENDHPLQIIQDLDQPDQWRQIHENLIHNVVTDRYILLDWNPGNMNRLQEVSDPSSFRIRISSEVQGNCPGAVPLSGHRWLECVSLPLPGHEPFCSQHTPF